MESTDKPWYKSLNKSKLTPPDYVFPIVWTILYLMIITSFVIYLSGNKTTLGIILFCIQMALNLSWSPVFFKFKKPKIALVIVGLMWISILGTIISFNLTNPLASYLLIPYLVWVSLATYLNYYIVANN